MVKLLHNVFTLFVVLCYEVTCFRPDRIRLNYYRNDDSTFLSPRNSIGVTNRDDDSFFRNYQRVNEIHDYMKNLKKENPDLVKVFSLGTTAEDRDLTVIKVGPVSSKSKPAVWIDGGTHAREWISPAVVLFILNKVIQSYGKNRIIRSFNWYFLPVVNPDGYEYSHQHERGWRKNRNPRNKTCPGVDLNRNWDHHWGEGASDNPCSDTYAGPRPFSEPETKAISDFLMKHRKKEKFMIFLAFHSFGQMWLTPWGWTPELPKDYGDMIKAGRKAVNALSKVNGRKYKLGAASQLIGKASGCSHDWAYGVPEIKYSYTVELPDTQTGYGFMLPESQILGVGQETWIAVKALVTEVKKIENKGKVSRKIMKKTTRWKIFKRLMKIPLVD